MEEQCTICMSVSSSNVKIGPCMHGAFCYDCISNWLSVQPTCPFCRRSSYGIVNNTMLTVLDKGKKKITFSLAGAHAGITVENIGNKVRIRQLHKQDAFYCNGIRRGGIIEYVNGVRVTQHQICTRLVQQATDSQTNLTLVMS